MKITNIFYIIIYIYIISFQSLNFVLMANISWFYKIYNNCGSVKLDCALQDNCL
jgi:hypothetical protein